MKTISSRPPSDLDIQALVDSELDVEESIRIMEWINKDPLLLARYEELLEQKKLLLNWWESEKFS